LTENSTKIDVSAQDSITEEPSNKTQLSESTYPAAVEYHKRTETIGTDSEIASFGSFGPSVSRHNGSNNLEIPPLGDLETRPGKQAEASRDNDARSSNRGESPVTAGGGSEPTNIAVG
jgi:hypothetical protein